MNILIVEDTDTKCEEIIESITSRNIQYKINFYRARNVYEYVKIINSSKFDIIIFDIILPPRENHYSIDVSIELIDELNQTVNINTPSIALTEQDSPEYDTLIRFNEKLIPVISYKKGNLECFDKLNHYIDSLTNLSRIDFLIICALEKEAEAYCKFTGPVLDEWKIETGSFRWRSICIGEAKGILCLPPRAGLTSAALCTSKAIEKLKPKLVIMSGICAGVKGKVEFLDIIVPNLAWDYQVGKITNKGFKAEPYQEEVDPDIISRLKHEWVNEDFKTYIKEDTWKSTKGKFDPEVHFEPIASGSAVVSDKLTVHNIGEQHRKFLGIEMEVSAVFSACKYSTVRPLFFAAKSVVDFADEDKNDSVQEQACILSAKYCFRMIPIVISII